MGSDKRPGRTHQQSGINAMTGVLGLPSRVAADRPEIREAMIAELGLDETETA